MAANTVVDWTLQSNANGTAIWKLTVLIDTANAMAWTKKTPKQLDPTRPWNLVVSMDGEVDGQACPLDIYLGYSDLAALAGTSAITATDAVKFQQIIDDLGYANQTTKAFLFAPTLGIANVVTTAAIATGLKSSIPPAPYYLFNVNGGSVLEARTLTFLLIQKAL